ncbi:MAG: hypothetical protein QOE27_1584 [Solirubrobacteraceae bacterium]|nr:hypothetical protein [Solirubrobacteraceae bacterium]MEA2355251.1 hypothetical protein [Solirubrobacteraceae bacterium]
MGDEPKVRGVARLNLHGTQMLGGIAPDVDVVPAPAVEQSHTGIATQRAPTGPAELEAQKLEVGAGRALAAGRDSSQGVGRAQTRAGLR